MNDYALGIFDGNDQVATLAFDPQSEFFSLAYEPGWIASKRGYQLSPRLPFDGSASSGTVKRFVENLLPEGNALDVASTYANISKNNIFGLVRHLGRETAGALTFLPDGQLPQELKPGRRELPLEELERRIHERAQHPFNVWDGKVRMSVAGYQDKLLVFVEGARLHLAEGSLASTHILKPEPGKNVMPFMVANEHFCMTLANRISQERFKEDFAAGVQILRVPSPVLCVRRFDRQGVEDGVQRFHIIDACQALDISVGAKYERNMGFGDDVKHIRDGVSFERLKEVRSHFERPAIGMQRLLFWAATTLLFGNSDAHGKNVSFYSRRAGLSVAELYDLVCVVQYEHIQHDLAMAFGDEFVLDSVKAFALADFCERFGLKRPYLARELKRLCEIARVQAPVQAQDTVYEGGERAFVQKLADFVVARADALISMTSDIPRFNPDNF